MTDRLIQSLDKYLKEGARHRAHSYKVSSDFFADLLARLRDDEKTIEQLRKAFFDRMKPSITIKKVYALMGNHHHEEAMTISVYASKESADREAQRRTEHRATEPNWSAINDDDYETYHVEERELLP